MGIVTEKQLVKNRNKNNEMQKATRNRKVAGELLKRFAGLIILTVNPTGNTQSAIEKK
jgi:hypothetical protein